MRCLFRVALSLAVATGLTATILSADKNDKKKPETKSAPMGEYINLGDVNGVLAKSESSTLVVRVNPVMVPAGLGQFVRPVAGDKGGKAGGRLQPREFEMNLEMTADVKIRLMKLPPRTDPTGKKIPYTTEELVKLKGKSNLGGYEAESSDLKPGQFLKLHLVRIKGAEGEAANKPFVSRIYIEGEGPAPAQKQGDKKPEKKN